MRTNAFLAECRTPLMISNQFERAYAEGRLDAIQEVMEVLESDNTLSIDDALAELHFKHMGQNNEMVDRFGVGEPINCVEYYTDKYGPSLESPKILQ